MAAGVGEEGHLEEEGNAPTRGRSHQSPENVPGRCPQWIELHSKLMTHHFTATNISCISRVCTDFLGCMQCRMAQPVLQTFAEEVLRAA